MLFEEFESGPGFFERYNFTISETTPSVTYERNPDRIAAFRAGKLDIMINSSPEYAFDLLKALPELKYIKHDTRATLDVIHIRCDQGPAADLRVRRALMLALDNQAMLDKLHLSYGSLMQNCWLQEGFPQYVPLEELPAHIRELAEYHPDKAKQLLEEAGYPNGFKTKMLVPHWEWSQDEAAVCKAYWEKIGVDCEIQVT